MITQQTTNESHIQNEPQVRWIWLYSVSEWETPEHAHQGLGKVLVNHELLQIHNKGVLAHLDMGPYYMLFAPMMEEGTWREHMNNDSSDK